jgi:hypothetical protein
LSCIEIEITTQCLSLNVYGLLFPVYRLLFIAYCYNQIAEELSQIAVTDQEIREKLMNEKDEKNQENTF